MTHLLQQTTHLDDPATGALIISLLKRGIEQNEKILEEHTNIKASLAAHVLSEETLVKGLVNAFPKKPDGTPDYEGHEVFHSALISESRARTVFYRELRQELIKKGLWSLVMILVALVSYWWTGHIRGPQ